MVYKLVYTGVNQPLYSDAMGFDYFSWDKWDFSIICLGWTNVWQVNSSCCHTVTRWRKQLTYLIIYLVFSPVASAVLGASLSSMLKKWASLGSTRSKKQQSEGLIGVELAPKFRRIFSYLIHKSDGPDGYGSDHVWVPEWDLQTGSPNFPTIWDSNLRRQCPTDGDSTASF